MGYKEVFLILFVLCIFTTTHWSLLFLLQVSIDHKHDNKPINVAFYANQR
jgi:hypothetical protein